MERERDRERETEREGGVDMHVRTCMRVSVLEHVCLRVRTSCVTLVGVQTKTKAGMENQLRP